MVGDLGKNFGLEQFWFCSLRKLDLVSLLDNLNRMRNLHNIVDKYVHEVECAGVKQKILYRVLLKIVNVHMDLGALLN